MDAIWTPPGNWRQASARCPIPCRESCRPIGSKILFRCCGNPVRCGGLMFNCWQTSWLSIHLFKDFLARSSFARSEKRQNFAVISSNASFWKINTSIVDTIFNVDTRFWAQSKWVLCIKQRVGTVVAACGREWRFLSYSKPIQRNFEGSKFMFWCPKTVRYTSENATQKWLQIRGRKLALRKNTKKIIQ